MHPTGGHGTRLGRRRLLRRLLAGAGAGAGLVLLRALRGRPGTAAGAAPAATPPPPGAPPDRRDVSGVTVPADDPAIVAGPVEYPGVITSLLGYLSAPRGGEVYPGVLVLHDVAGLTEHVRDVTRRLAKAGYVALAPDLLSRRGGTAGLGDPARVGAALGAMAISQYLEDLNSSVAYLEAYPLAAKTRTGVLGYGLGGNLAWALLSQNTDVRAAVVFDGGVPPSGVLARIGAAVLAIFSETDRQEAQGIPDLDAAMKKTGVPWAYRVEPKAGRGFFDDTRDRYVPDAARDAWRLTLGWFGEHLAG